jgi:hypothetical protein
VGSQAIRDGGENSPNSIKKSYHDGVVFCEGVEICLEFYHRLAIFDDEIIPLGT